MQANAEGLFSFFLFYITCTFCFHVRYMCAAVHVFAYFLFYFQSVFDSFFLLLSMAVLWSCGLSWWRWNSPTDLGGNGVVFGGWCFVNAVVMILVWPMAYCVKKIPGMNQILWWRLKYRCILFLRKSPHFFVFCVAQSSFLSSTAPHNNLQFIKKREAFLHVV